MRRISPRALGFVAVAAMTLLPYVAFATRSAPESERMPGSPRYGPTTEERESFGGGGSTLSIVFGSKILSNERPGTYADILFGAGEPGFRPPDEWRHRLYVIALSLAVAACFARPRRRSSLIIGLGGVATTVGFLVTFSDGLGPWARTDAFTVLLSFGAWLSAAAFVGIVTDGLRAPRVDEPPERSGIGPALATLLACACAAVVLYGMTVSVFVTHPVSSVRERYRELSEVEFRSWKLLANERPGSEDEVPADPEPRWSSAVLFSFENRWMHRGYVLGFCLAVAALVTGRRGRLLVAVLGLVTIGGFLATFHHYLEGGAWSADAEFGLRLATGAWLSLVGFAGLALVAAVERRSARVPQPT